MIGEAVALSAAQAITNILSVRNLIFISIKYLNCIDLIYNIGIYIFPL